MVRSRRVSPIDLTEGFLDRLESLGPRYNAVVTLTRERAIDEARRAEKEIGAGTYRGPLHGIPYGAKDLLATSGGIPTTWGAAPLRGQLFDYDATVIARLDSAGAVLAAKLSMVELAGGMHYDGPDASLTGPNLNPWDEQHWSGGSSGGSASAVAGGLVPFAIGSETWGSILIPAAYCGVTGLRPTFGRVSRYGAMPLSASLDKLGPLGQTADDCGLVLDAIAGPDSGDPAAATRPYHYSNRSGSQDRNFRLAVLKDATEGADGTVRSSFGVSLKVLEEVAEIDELALPDYPYPEITQTIYAPEALGALEEFITSGKAAELSASKVVSLLAGAAVSAKDYLKALRVRSAIAREVDEALASFDAVIGPSAPRVALQVGEDWTAWAESNLADVLGAVGNVFGLPAVSIPNGFSDQGLPSGIQFMGRAYQENTIIAVARRFQSLTDWHKRHPEGTVTKSSAL